MPSEIRPDDPRSIREMFEGLAPGYDRLNTALTFGMVRGWRRALVRETRIRPGQRVVDVCSGTGQTLAEVEAFLGGDGLVVGIDFTPAMLERSAGRRVLGDALRLPFPDAAFDAAVSAFALRDVADQEAMVREMVRVARPGGRVGILEIGRPRRQPFRFGFDAWFRGVVPRVAALAGHGSSHRFLVRSLSFLPAPERLCRWMREAGLADVSWRELSLGAARIFAGTRRQE